MIRSTDGRLAFWGSTQLAVRRIAKYLKISEEVLEERMRTPTRHEIEREILKHT